MEMQYIQSSQEAYLEISLGKKTDISVSFTTFDCSLPKDNFPYGLGIESGFQNKQDLLSQVHVGL